ncbi:MAG: hypothetical protein AAF907_10145 [Planctomycetota bacterium]
MAIPDLCPVCGAPDTQFKRSLKTGRARCEACGEIFEPDAGSRPIRSTRSVDREAIRAKLNGPSIYMIVVDILGVLLGVGGCLLCIAILSLVPANEFDAPEDRIVLMFYAAFLPFVALMNVFILYGARKMRRLESYVLCQVAAGLCAVPFCNTCGIRGCPGGIWALVVLNDTAVKSAFR